MINEECVYVGFFDPDNGVYRSISLACNKKMRYLTTVLRKLTKSVTILSPCWAKRGCGKQNGIHTESDGVTVLIPHSIANRGKLSEKIACVNSLMWLFIQLVRSTNCYTNVVVYHSPLLYFPIKMAKLFKRFRLILEMEEYYQDAAKMPKRFSSYENKLVKLADKYIISTELLITRLKLNPNNCVICYGDYRMKPKYANPVHNHILLYSGIIDHIKQGAFNAAHCIEALPHDYQLRILGFGKDKSELQEVVNEYKKKGYNISLHDTLSGDEYIKFCQNCSIGLSTQTIKGKYLQSSFPSKVIDYMSMGLSVVAGKMDCLTKSKISRYITYYDEEQPDCIAKAIEQCSNQLYKREDYIELFSSLEEQLIIEIGKFLS